MWSSFAPFFAGVFFSFSLRFFRVFLGSRHRLHLGHVGPSSAPAHPRKSAHPRHPHSWHSSEESRRHSWHAAHSWQCQGSRPFLVGRPCQAFRRRRPSSERFFAIARFFMPGIFPSRPRVLTEPLHHLAHEQKFLHQLHHRFVGRARSGFAMRVTRDSAHARARWDRLFRAW